MKRILTVAACLFAAGTSFAQTDSTESKTDTVKVGNFIIIKKSKGGTGDETGYKKRDKNLDLDMLLRIERRPARNKNISTNWWIFDLGFANMRDNTDYAYAQAGSYFRTLRPADGPVNADSYRLITGKSTNVNLWFFMQKLNVSKHVLNLKYGLGLEMYNFRYDTRLSYRKDPQPYVYNDSISFSKNKLYAGYLTVPFMVNVNTTPNSRKGFSFSAGVSAGYLLSSRNKQISAERGKQKINGDFNLEPWRFAAIGEMGIGPVRLYGSYSLNKFQKDITRVEQFPYAVGVRFSRW
ncbi:MAG TPA: outer membrane beta-barrel protein [Sediminibacterium sp.]|nr:outer membrane beta-barrel protein [Sediminibacterium sp.]